MAKFQVRRVRLAPGIVFPTLVRDGLQVYETSWWAIDELSPGSRGSAPNTIQAKLRAVAHWFVWAENNGFDWVNAVRSGSFMSAKTIDKVLKWMQLEVDLSGLERTKRLRIAPHTSSARTKFLHQYLKWYANRLIEAMAPSEHKLVVKAAFIEWGSAWQTLAGKAFPRDAPERPPEVILDDQQRELFRRVIRPGDPGNPWRARAQARNYALLMLLYEHGLRIGDVMKLRMDDVQIEKGLFTIAERTADFLEVRVLPPDSKRRGRTKRTLRFTPDSLEAMQMWLGERSRRDIWPRATQNAFVFLSHWKSRSKALALRRPGQLFHDLCRAFPKMRSKTGQILQVGFSDDYFHPHALRHDCAVRYVLGYHAKHGEWNLQGAESMRKLFGWAKDSRQPAYYAGAAHLEIGIKAMLELTEYRTRMGLAMDPVKVVE